MRKKILIIAAASMLLLPLIFAGCAGGKGKEVSKTEFLLGTVCTVTIYDETKEKAIDEAFARVRELEDMMTIRNATDSEIIRLNEAAGTGNYVKLSPDTLAVLKRSIRFAELTGGRFDPTVGVLTTMWNIGSEDARVPSEKEISDALKLIGYGNIAIDEDGGRARLLKKGTVVDLGAIAKGYAGDIVRDILVKNGVTSAIINMGGNVVLVGGKTDGTDWKVGVQDPLGKQGTYMMTVTGKDTAVVSSGIYERFLEVDGVKYHHIIDPATGYPAENNVAGTTIVNASSMDADGYSTSIFLEGVDKGMKMLNENGIDGIIITKDKKIYVSDGLKSKFNLVDTTYKVVN